MKTQYWKSTPDAVVITESNKISYFMDAGVLQVSKPDWEDERGYTKPGKTVAINLENAPADFGDLLIQIGNTIKAKAALE